MDGGVENVRTVLTGIGTFYWYSFQWEGISEDTRLKREGENKEEDAVDGAEVLHGVREFRTGQGMRSVGIVTSDSDSYRRRLNVTGN